MEFSLSAERKIEILNQVKNSLEHELYMALTYQGEDPESFDIEAYEAPEDPARAMQYARVTELVDNLNKINNKISNLG